MQKSKPASKETIANLTESAGLAIDDLYKELKGGLAVRALMDECTPELYIITQDLQNGIKFILMDICVSCRAVFSTDNSYEKRFHLKNIQASISEGYKLLFNFGKMREKSLWKMLMNTLMKDDNIELIPMGYEIEKRLVEYGNTEIDQKLRDLTLHYDKRMIEVYHMTISIESEEKVMQMVCCFLRLLQDIQLFSDKVDAFCLAKTGVDKPFPSFPIKLEVNPGHTIACKLINKDGIIESIFDNLPKSVVNSLDSMADHWCSTIRIEEYIRANATAIGEVPEIEDVKVITNIQLLLRFMMLDLVAIVDAYIKPSSDIEHALNLRRVCITKVSTIVHLYGYNSSEEENSIWKRIGDIIPKGSAELINEWDKINVILSKIAANVHDRDLRTTFIHLFDNSKACSDLPAVVNAIEAINPIAQMLEIQLLLEIYSRLIKFSTTLMNALAKEAHDKKIQSTKTLNDMMDELILKYESSQLPDENKKQVVEMLLEIKRKMNELEK